MALSTARRASTVRSLDRLRLRRRRVGADVVGLGHHGKLLLRGPPRRSTSRPEQLVRARQRHPARHRAATSLARSRYAVAPADDGAKLVIGSPATVVSGNRVVRLI